MTFLDRLDAFSNLTVLKSSTDASASLCGIRLVSPKNAVHQTNAF